MSVIILSRKADGVSILDVSGKLVLGEASSNLREAIRDLVVREHRKILVNLSEVTYIDSAGMGELIAGYTSATNSGGELHLLGLTKRVKDLLQITKLYTVFEIHDNEAEAIRSFQ